ncbi:MAG: rRNA maturation RNase YbeY [Motiliproteus sp.]
MSIEIDLQLACQSDNLPIAEQLQQWVELALRQHRDTTDTDSSTATELCIRIVDDGESRQLNNDYRGKDKPTNVLSFPFEAPPGIDLHLLGDLPLGDLVICAPVVAREALEQHKPLQHHWAHMVVHGTLHLLGYDHISEQQAQQMEPLETLILARLDIADPYDAGN